MTPITKRRLAIFLDGTWNAVGDNTNVWRTRALLDLTGGDQLAYYDFGVNGFWGGAFGKGLIQNVADAYQWLVENYVEGDDIFVFGFSRGAFTARSLTGLIAKYGLLKAGAPLGVKQLLKRYERSDTTIWQFVEKLQQAKTLEERWIVKHSQPIPIKMVAVWDTVGARSAGFQLPGD